MRSSYLLLLLALAVGFTALAFWDAPKTHGDGAASSVMRAQLDDEFDARLGASETVEPSVLILAEPAQEARELAAEPLVDDAFPLATESSDADDASVLCSSWARFPVGSWARRRTTSVTYEEGKLLQTVTETRILLKSVDCEAKRYELQYDSTLKLGAVDYSRKSETVLYDFWDVPVDDNTTVETLAPANLVIGLKAIPCKTRRVVRETDKTKETTTVWYSNVVAPYVFQRQAIKEQKSDPPHTTRELFVVQKIPAFPKLSVAPTKYIAKSSSVSSSRKLAKTIVYSTEIPGGVLRENAQETRSAADPTVYQTDSVLLDYYIAR